MAEHGTPDPSSSRAPVHSGIGSKIGYRHHQPCRSAFIRDATGSDCVYARGWQQKVGTKVAEERKRRGLRGVRGLALRNHEAKASHGFTRIFTDLKHQLFSIRVDPWKSVAKGLLVFLHNGKAEAPRITRSSRIFLTLNPRSFAFSAAGFTGSAAGWPVERFRSSAGIQPSGRNDQTDVRSRMRLR